METSKSLGDFGASCVQIDFGSFEGPAEFFGALSKSNLYIQQFLKSGNMFANVFLEIIGQFPHLLVAFQTVRYRFGKLSIQYPCSLKRRRALGAADWVVFHLLKALSAPPNVAGKKQKRQAPVSRRLPALVSVCLISTLERAQCQALSQKLCYSLVRRCSASILRQTRTLSLCSLSVLANAWPPVPSATKNR